MSIYKQASKEGLRFLTTRGPLTVEQLWDLPLANLTDCIKSVKKTLSKEGTEDDDLAFLDVNVVVDKTQQLRFDILKDVYLTRRQDNLALKEAKENKAQREKIMELIEKKKEEGLGNKSIEELQAMLKS